MNFKELNIISPILTAIERTGYHTPTEIQRQTIPHILNKKDVIGCAQTGTGKTASFAIPILQLLNEKEVKNRHIKALILTPTRELAIQISDNFKAYSTELSLRHVTIFGGVSQEKQVSQVRKGCDILIATPGRLLDLINQGIVKLSSIELFVLDEADRMLDSGFIHDIKKILTKLPKKKQTLFFSATMPPEIRSFAQSILYKPVEINVTPVSSTAQTIHQSLYIVEKAKKQELLISLLKETNIERTLIFTRTKYGADKLVKNLAKVGIQAAAIHGNKSQNARQRALEGFKTNRITILIATDIAARGIDIDELPNVINFELPNIPETYVHRIGRTGRAGTKGNAISFCDETEKKDLNNIQKLIGFKIPINKLEY